MNKVLIKLPGYDKYAINYLRKREIDILNVTVSSEGNIYMIYEADLEKLDEDVIQIVSYRGVKKIIKMLFANKHFVLAVLTAITLMFLISNVVVQVEVIHSNKDVRILVEDELYDHGIKPFILKKSFGELQNIKEQIKKLHPQDIEWLEINDEGMRYTVRVEERIITREEEEPPYCNVVSLKDAIVLSSVAKKGQTVVLPNDFVKKDSVLIRGQVMFNENTKSYVCADGTVYGNTWYKVDISVPLTHDIKNYTGKKKPNLGFEFGSVYNRLFKVHFDDYDVKKAKLFGIGRFALYKESVEEYTPEEKTYTEEEALEEALKQAREKLFVKIPKDSQILDEKVLQSSSYDSIISVEIFYSVKEVISTKVEAEIVVEDNTDTQE